MRILTAILILAFINIAVALPPPEYERTETLNAVQIHDWGGRLGVGFCMAEYYVGYRDENGVFSPNEDGLQRIFIKNWPDNMLMSQFNNKLWTRIRAVENTDPLLDMSIIIQAYWELLLCEHVLRSDETYPNGTPLEEIDVDTMIEVYAEDKIAILAGEDNEPVLAVEPTTLALDGASQGVIEVSNTGVETLTWVGKNLNTKLSLSPPNGNLAASSAQSVIVNVDRTGLAAGAYEDTFTIDSNGGSIQVTVNIVIQPAVLLLSTSTLDFGDTLTELFFDISNDGEAPLTWQCQSDHSAITFASTGTQTITGSTDSGNSVTVDVEVDRDGVPPGEYDRNIAVTSNGGSGNITVLIVVP